jgi:hypothetical protein
MEGTRGHKVLGTFDPRGNWILPEVAGVNGKTSLAPDFETGF